MSNVHFDSRQPQPMSRGKDDWKTYYLLMRPFDKLALHIIL